MDETSPNIAHFLRLFNSRSIIEKKTGETKNGIFLQIALNIALDMDRAFPFPRQTITKKYVDKLYICL